MTDTIDPAARTEAGISSRDQYQHGAATLKLFGALSDSQKAFLRAMIAAKVKVAVCFNISQVFDRVHAWGLTRPMRVMA